MDDSIELIIPDNIDYPDVGGIFPDFSQVQIQVHGADVAAKIMDVADQSQNHEFMDIADQSQNHESYGTEQYHDVEIYDGIQEISDESEHTQEDSVQTPEEFESNTENFLKGIIKNTQEDIDMSESDSFQGNRIPDHDISKYDVVIEEYPDYENVTIKEEFESFMSADYTHFDAAPREEHNSDDLQPEDGYHCNNVIILGSKPCPSMSDSILRRMLSENDEGNEILKENLDAVVLLDDCGAKLQKSHSFCEECGTLFATIHDLDVHKMIAHSLLVPVSRNVAIKSTTKPAFTRKSTGSIVVKNTKNIARKSTGSKTKGSSFCNHCNKVFPDNTTLITHLYELLPLKQSVSNMQKDLINQPEKVIVKKEKTAVAQIDEKPFNEKAKRKSSALLETGLEAIPKSVLFQCPTCSVHFVTAYAGFLHNMYCGKSMGRKKPPTCDMCKRKIHPRDVNIHKKQHKLCTKFRVFKVKRSLSEKTLCKCPNCELHFSDLGITLHLKECGKIPSAHCQKCNLLVPKTRIYLHMRMHMQQKLKPKDFLQIQYSIQRSPIKRKLQPPVMPTKKIKLEYKKKKNNKNAQKHVEIEKNRIINMSEREKPVLKVKKGMLSKEGHKNRMYFCSNCKGCCYRNSHQNIHMKKQCNLVLKVICTYCGLQFHNTTIKYHRSVHKKGFSLHNIAFFNICSLKRTVPSIPNYPQCAECKIKFFDAKLQADHICGEDYQTCHVCNDKYHNSAYNAHIEFHKLIDSKPTKTETKLIPELMKKYKSLNMMWNLVYSCQKCDIITDQYDKAVEHCQGHLINKATMKNIKCYICNLKFDETCWSKHSELHAQMNVNSKDFKILSYDPKKLLTKEWFELFHSLPKEQIRQVTNKSLYSYERRFKLKLLKEGRSEYTVYCCSECKVACRSNEIEKHINNPCRSTINICTVCSLPFSDISTLKNHQILHLKGIKKEEFRVVIFIKQQTTNKKRKKANIKQMHTKKKQPKLAKQKQTKQKPRVLTKRTKKLVKAIKSIKNTYKGMRIDSNGKFVLYRCKNCKICIHINQNVHRHECGDIKNLQKCRHCNELIYIKYLEHHEKRHRERSDFNNNNFIFKIFHPNNKTFISDSEMETVENKCKPVNSSKQAKRNISASAVEAIDYPTKAKADTSNTATVAKGAIVYKCECGLHYTSLKTIEKHMETCGSETEISKEHCSKCGLLFPTDVLVSHLCKHHSKNSKFTVQSYQKELCEDGDKAQSPVPSKGLSCQVKLYKCGKCNVCFVNQNTCYRHVYKNHKNINPRICIDCKLCGLQFTINTLSVHVMRHHSNELSLGNVLVEEYHPPEGEVPLAIDTYVAADKVQFFHVTSSIDESILG